MNLLPFPAAPDFSILDRIASVTSKSAHPFTLNFYSNDFNTVLVQTLDNGFIKVTFITSPRHAVYIKAENKAQFLERLKKGIYLVLRDLYTNPHRTTKHAIIFNA